MVRAVYRDDPSQLRHQMEISNWQLDLSVPGDAYPTIPAGCTTPNVGGTTYFLCGSTWFQPFDGANGIYYRVVPTP